MTDAFIQLPPEDRADILQAAASELGHSAQILEKDVWVCWALEALFSMPGAHPIAFKGGTSLSKLWNAIDRFSEDVDITIDYRAFGTGFDHRQDQLSGNQQSKVNEQLLRCAREYIAETVQPYLQERLDNDLGDQTFSLTPTDDGESLFIVYPKAPFTGNPYIVDSIRLEFGGRNTLEPSDRHTVTPYIAESKSVSGVHYPIAKNVLVISVARTFWEKVTLAHSTCGKKPSAARAERMSRHWYDLAMLVKKEVISVEELLQQGELLEEVIALKNVFFRASYNNYEACLVGKARLIPDGEYLGKLKADYEEMRNDYIGREGALTFDEIIECVQYIEETMNQHYESQTVG